MNVTEIAQQVDAKHIAGKKLAEQKQPQNALKVYDEAITIAQGDPGMTAWIRFDKGKTLTSLGRYDEATTEFQQAKGTLGENTWIYTELGNAAIGLKKLASAEQEFHSALNLNPDNGEAAQGLEKIKQLKQQAELLHIQGVQKRNSGDKDGALNAYSQAISLVGEETVPWSVFDLGITLEGLGRYDEALVKLHRSKELLPGAIWPDIEIGNVYIAEKDLIKAEKYFGELQRDYSKSDAPGERLAHIKKLREEAEHFHAEGVRFRDEGNLQTAEEQYRLAIDRVGEENAPWSLFDLGTTLTRSGKLDEALFYLQKAKIYLPNIPWPDVEIGRNYIQQRQILSAEALLQETNDTYPGIESVSQLLQEIKKLKQQSEAAHEAGQEYFRVHDYESAARQYKYAVTLVGEQSAPISMLNLGTSLHLLGRYDEALFVLLKLEEFKQDSPLVYTEIGDIYTELFNFEEAIKYYASALTLKEDDSRAKIGLNRIRELREQGIKKPVPEQVQIPPEFTFSDSAPVRVDLQILKEYRDRLADEDIRNKAVIYWQEARMYDGRPFLQNIDETFLNSLQVIRRGSHTFICLPEYSNDIDGFMEIENKVNSLHGVKILMDETNIGTSILLVDEAHCERPACGIDGANVIINNPPRKHPNELPEGKIAHELTHREYGQAFGNCLSPTLTEGMAVYVGNQVAPHDPFNTVGYNWYGENELRWIVSRGEQPPISGTQVFNLGGNQNSVSPLEYTYAVGARLIQVLAEDLPYYSTSEKKWTWNDVVDIYKIACSTDLSDPLTGKTYISNGQRYTSDHELISFILSVKGVSSRGVQELMRRRIWREYLGAS